MRKLDVLLINPGDRSQIYQNLGDEFSAIEPPSMAALIATYLRSGGLSVEIIDQPALGMPAHVVAAEAVARDALLTVLVVYGFQPSASTQTMPAAGAIAQHMNEIDPTRKIMMMGTHPAALPLRTLQEEAIDFVCIGEGPREIASLVTVLKAGGTNFDGIAGVWYKIGGVIYRNPSAPLIETLDYKMRGAAWDLLPMEKYRAHNWHAFEHINKRQPYASIHTTLGCPYRCSFCCINAPFGKPSYRMWSPSTIGAEIQKLVDLYGVRNIKFVDEMFVLNKSHVLGVCEEITKRGLGEHINIWAYARIDTVRPEFLEPLRAAGFRWLALGIESGSKHVRDGSEKNLKSEDIIGVVRQIQTAGINVIGNYIFGLPDDTMDTMRETLDLALEANCEFANFYSAMAYPGSKLYDMARKNDWSLPENWSGYSQHSFDTTPLPTETLTSAEVLWFRDMAFRAYFTNPTYQAMVEKKFGSEVVAHLMRMLAQPLPRKLVGQQNLGSEILELERNFQ